MTSPESSTRTGYGGEPRASRAALALCAATSAKSRDCTSGTSGPTFPSSTPRILSASRSLFSLVVTKTALMARESNNPCALYDTVAAMQEVRVESLDGLEMRGSELRLSANAGRLRIVFPKEIWDHVLTSAETSDEPDAAELEELYAIKETLKAHAEEQSFESALEGVQVRGPGLEYDLVLRPAGLLAV